MVLKPGTATVTLEELKASSVDLSSEKVQLVAKVWGHERWLANDEKYCCKTLTLKKGYQCSLHYHKLKDETFFVLDGRLRL